MEKVLKPGESLTTTIGANQREPGIDLPLRKDGPPVLRLIALFWLGAAVVLVLSVVVHSFRRKGTVPNAATNGIEASPRIDAITNTMDFYPTMTDLIAGVQALATPQTRQCVGMGRRHIVFHFPSCDDSRGIDPSGKNIGNGTGRSPNSPEIISKASKP